MPTNHEKAESKAPLWQRKYDSIKKDPLHGKRVHCWVLVRAGARDVNEMMYVEPTMGTLFPTARAPYLNINCIWNKTKCAEEPARR